MKTQSQGMRVSLWLTLLFLSLLPGIAWAQEEEQEQEVDYTQEQYDAYTKAVNEADPAAREKAILAFMKEFPSLSLVKYALGSYLQTMQDYQQKGEPEKVLNAAEKLLAIKPDDANVEQMATIAAFQLGSYDKVIGYGEKIYARSPNSGMAYILAISYQATNKMDKFKEFGEKALAEVQPKDFLPGHFQILVGLRAQYVEKDWAKAAAFSRRTVEAFDAAARPAGTSESEWNKYANKEKGVSYMVLGRSAVEAQNWSEAVSNYQKAMQFWTEPIAKAEAFFYIGRGRWEQGRLDPAMEAFAKGSVQPGAPHAAPCRQYLERLYRSTHNDSTAGLEEYVARVAPQP